MALAPQFINVPNLGLTKFTNGDGTSTKTIFTAGANGSRILSMCVTSNDLSSRQVQLAIVRGGVSYKLSAPTIPAAAAETPVVNLNLLDPSWFGWLDANEPHLMVPAGVTFEVTPLVAVSSGKEISVMVFAGDY